MLPPSVETKTSDFSWLVPEKPAAICSRIAVEGMLVAAPLPSATSRWAISAIWRSELPGRVSSRFRRSTSSPSNDASKVCSATSADGIASKRSWTNCGHRPRRTRCPGRGSANCSVMSRVRTPAASESKASGARVDSIGSGGCCSENIATTSATGAASRAVLQMRRSITSPRRVSGMARGQARILLVDDEQAVQTLLTYPLRKEGYEVVGALDGQEALDRFSEQRFDLVVLDIMLPKLDGIEVCRRLRTRSQVPIIMLTAKGDEIDKVVGLEMGADDYITKPFSVREFRSRVKAALRRGSMPRGPSGDAPIRAADLEIDFERRTTTVRGEQVAADVRRVRDPRGAGEQPGPRLQPREPAGAGLGRLHLPRPAHRRRPHTPPAREARDRPEVARVPVHGARRRLPLPRPSGGMTRL